MTACPGREFELHLGMILAVCRAYVHLMVRPLLPDYTRYCLKILFFMAVILLPEA